MRDKILSKIFSGRFILTVVSAIIFCFMAMKGTMPEEAVAAIIAMVFQAYFSKKREEKDV